MQCKANDIIEIDLDTVRRKRESKSKMLEERYAIAIYKAFSVTCPVHFKTLRCMSDFYDQPPLHILMCNQIKVQSLS